MRHIWIAAEPTAKHHCGATMIRSTLQSALCLCLSPLLIAQQSTGGELTPAVPESVPAAQAKVSSISLRKGTVMALALLESVSSATAQKGQTVRLALAEDLIVGGTVVIRRGAPAIGVIESVRKAILGKLDGDLQIKLVTLTPQDMSPIALKESTPPDSDGFCGGFISCLLVFVVLAIPYWTGVGIVKAVKAPFHRHHTPVAHTPVVGKDLVLSPCEKIWGKTVASSQINHTLPDPFQPSEAAIDFDAVCPARTAPAPSGNPEVLPEPISPHA